ncbi:MAG: WD40/YVTN/BNR-like repeat-containing protein, partial [Acidimicrobiales bacterium]
MLAVSLIGASTVMQLGAAPPAVAAPVPITFTDVNPDVSPNPNPNSATGGRTNGLASASGNNQVFYAATEFGGIYRTTNGGANWAHLPGHRPMVTWDVEVDPTNNNRVYATSFFDGRTAPVSGINVSGDAGATWTHPATATPPAASSANYGGCATVPRTSPSAFG